MFCEVYIFAACFAIASSWTTDELGMFDLVEELNVTFYELFSVSKTATQKEIKKSYYRLSLVWHPDKNSAPDAAVRFRQLSAVYDVLKDETLRKAYDEVLEFGLPDWRQPIFYYRRMRKLPWWESALLISLIMTIGHYLVLWGSYFEKRLAIDERVSNFMKKKEKRLKRQGVDVDKMISDEISMSGAPTKPGFRDVLPLSLGRATAHFICALPSYVKAGLNWWTERQQAKVALELEKIRLEEELKEMEQVKEAKKLHRRKKAEEAKRNQPKNDGVPVLKPIVNRQRQRNHENSSSESESDSDENSFLETFVQTGDWSTQDLVSLIRLSEKWPVGTSGRWEKIASSLNRRPNDVTKMFGQLKHLKMNEMEKLVKMAQSSVTADPSAGGGNEAEITTAGNYDDVANESPGADEKSQESAISDSWSVPQQKALENALRTFGRNWEKIAELVPGKTKEDCLNRYKELAEIVRKKRVNNTAESN